MIDIFAVNDPRADLTYINIRAPQREGAAIARANCDELWRDFAPFASTHFRAEFPYRFHQRWFEMYLAVSLLRAGLEIRCPDSGAPDIHVQRRDGRGLWFEATAPTGGDESNPDRVVYPPTPRPGEPPVAYNVPTERVILRVSGALHAKARQLRTYREQGIIGVEDQALVAINKRKNTMTTTAPSSPIDRLAQLRATLATVRTETAAICAGLDRDEDLRLQLLNADELLDEAGDMLTPSEGAPPPGIA